MRSLVSAAVAAAAVLVLSPVAPANADGLPVGATAEAPAVVSNRDGVEVFVVGADNFVYHTWNDRPADNSAWSAWHRLGNQKVVGALAAIRHQDDSLEVFARADDDRVVHIRRNCVFGTWCGWEQVASGLTLASPAVTMDRFGSPELFVHGLDHRLYRTSLRDDRWQAWTEIPSPQLMRGSPSASRSGDGSPQVLFEGANGQIFRSARSSGGFTPATQLGHLGERPLGRLAVAAYKQDNLWLPRVMTSTRSGVFATKQERVIATGTLVYSPWDNAFGSPVGDGGAGASDFVDGAGVLYTRFTDNSYRRQRHLDGFTGGWERVGDGSFSGPPAVINLAGKHFVFGRGLNGHIFVSSETGFRQRTWSGWHLI